MRLGLEPVSQPMPVLPGSTVSITIKKFIELLRFLYYWYLFILLQTLDTTAGVATPRTLEYPAGGAVKLENNDSVVTAFPSSTTPTTTPTSKGLPLTQDTKSGLW